jgi:hypothetical protein
MRKLKNEGELGNVSSWICQPGNDTELFSRRRHLLIP